MPRILVVDDEPGMRQVISKILVPLGYEIIGTDEGKRSLEITKEQDPDLVLLDIRLADMDSSEIVIGVNRIKPNIPIIILSGFGDVEAAAELIKLGAFDYISKPFKVNDFINIINKALVKTGYQKLASPQTPAPHAPEYAAANLNRPYESSATRSPIKISKSKTPLILLTGALALLLAAGGFFAYTKYFNLPEDAEFKIPCLNPSGVCFEGKTIWISDWAEENIYKLSFDKGVKTDVIFKTQDIAPTGLAFDGKNIWTSSSLEQKINRHRIDPSLSIEASFNSPGPSPAGLCFDGKNIWSADFQQGKIYKHKAGGAFGTETSFDVPAQNPCGLFFRGGYAYVADAKTNRIYKLSADTFFLAGIYEMPGFEGQKRHISSIGYDGKSVWACAGGIDKIFRYRISSLKRVQF